jgi:hypothetical protein
MAWLQMPLEFNVVHVFKCKLRLFLINSLLIQWNILKGVVGTLIELAISRMESIAVIWQH